MNPSPILAVAGKADTSILDALPHLAGMLMVLMTLAILWGVCAITAKLVQILMPEKIPAPPAPAGPASVAAPASENLSENPLEIAPEIVAVIAAAVTACTGGNIRVVSIKPISTSWEKAGRQSVLTSHRIR